MQQDDDEDEDEDEDDDDVPDVDTSQFKPPTKMVSFGLNRGRSSPSQRKAMGTSGSSKTSVHVCTNCGCETVKWHGRCPTCKEWNTLQEFAVQRERGTSARPPTFSSRPSSSWVAGGSSNEGDLFDGRAFRTTNDFINKPVRITEVFNKEGKNAKTQRIAIPDDEELTSVLGGGIMKGSLTLLGGTPGVGKSTLLLQTAASVASMSSTTLQGPVWYVSGEETAEQIASRAQRLQLEEPEMWLLSETHVDSLAEQVVTLMEAAASNTSQALFKGAQPPSLLFIDSIQTMICDAGGSSAAGGVTQMRECVALFLRFAKSTGIPIILVGHVTKSGDVAGPRTVEHMVDCVLYLEGVGTGDITNLRMLRASKNRFGSSDEVGVYEMTAGRLLPVSDPSSLLLSHRLNTEDSEGCAITVALEGLRAMTVEIQALVTACSGGPTVSSTRTVNGIAYSRLSLLMGVLQKRSGLVFGKQDVYVNVVGAVRLDKSRGGEGGSSSDLAVATALVSSLMSIPVRSDTAFVGEVGLLGELRPVAAIEKRVQEARRMGFSRIVTPVSSRKGYKKGSAMVTREHGIERVQCDTLLAAIKAGLTGEIPKRRRRSAKQDAVDSSKTAPRVRSLNKKSYKEPEAILDDTEEDGNSVYEEHAFIENTLAQHSAVKSAPGNLRDLNLDDVKDEDDDEVFM